MLSASNLPVEHNDEPLRHRPTTVLLLPAFIFIDNVTPHLTPQLINHYIMKSPTNTMLLADPITAPPLPDIPDNPFKTRPSPHKYLILMCSQRTRDARCGQSAPLLKREFERHLRPLGLYRDMHDSRPGGVGIYFISHVGGHKFSANLMIYRRADAVVEAWDKKAEEEVAGDTNGDASGQSDDQVESQRPVKSIVAEERMKEGAQCIWLARVRPEDCEGIIKYTVLQGKVVKPERQLRGGFDRNKGLVSW